MEVYISLEKSFSNSPQIFLPESPKKDPLDNLALESPLTDRLY